MNANKDWSVPDAGGIIDVPGRLQSLFNNIGMQLRLHTISDKNEVITVAHITQHADDFARSQAIEFAEWITKHSYQWFKEIGEKTIILWRPLYSNNKGITTEQMYDLFLDHQAKQSNTETK